MPFGALVHLVNKHHRVAIGTMCSLGKGHVQFSFLLTHYAPYYTSFWSMQPDDFGRITVVSSVRVSPSNGL